MFLLFWFTMRKPDLDTISPAKFGFWMPCPSWGVHYMHHRLVDTEWFWPLADLAATNARKEAIQLGSHCLSHAWAFWMKFLNNQHLSLRQPVPWYCHLLQVTVSKSCWAAAVAEFTVCFTVPLFWVLCFGIFWGVGSTWIFFKVWLQCLFQSSWFQSSTVPMFAPKFRCSKVYLLQSLTPLLVPRFDDSTYFICPMFYRRILTFLISALSHWLGVSLCSNNFEVQ